MVTAEVDAVPVRAGQAPDASAAPADARADARAKARATAAQELGLAKAYLANSMREKADAILQEILANYPDTAAASEARDLLTGAVAK